MNCTFWKKATFRNSITQLTLKSNCPNWISASNGDVLTGDSNGNVLVWRRGYNAVTKSLKKVRISERMSCEELAIFFANLAYTGA